MDLPVEKGIPDWWYAKGIPGLHLIRFFTSGLIQHIANHPSFYDATFGKSWPNYTTF